MEASNNKKKVDTNSSWEKMFKEVLDQIYDNCSFLNLEDYKQLVKLANKKENE